MNCMGSTTARTERWPTRPFSPSPTVQRYYDSILDDVVYPCIGIQMVVNDVRVTNTDRLKVEKRNMPRCRDKGQTDVRHVTILRRRRYTRLRH